MTVKQAIISAGLSVAQSGNDAFTGGPFWQASIDFAKTFGIGTIIDQIDRAYMAERTVASGANDDIDLAGVLTDVFGGVITMVKLVAIMIKNAPLNPDAVNTTGLKIGGGTNAFPLMTGTTPVITDVTPGGIFLMANPSLSGIGTVTAATADILRITNAAGAVNKYQIALLGRSA